MIKARYLSNTLRLLSLSLLLLVGGFRVFAGSKDYPDRPNPPRLVNDFAGILSGGESAQLESKLDNFAQNTSTQITIVTIKSLGEHDIEEYTVELFNRWGIGQAGKKNGVLLLVSLNDRKAWITVGSGLEGVLTDERSGQIFRNEIVPAFRTGNYYQGLSNAADAIMAVTRGEYNADKGVHPQGRHLPGAAFIVLIIFIVIIIRILRGGGGGGNYMSGGGFGNFAAGMFLGNLLGGGGRGWGGSNDDWGGGGGFGGFGGGSSSGGGAGGSW